MRKYCYLLVLLTGFCIHGYAQNDSIVYATGKIINAETKEPIKAKISYMSLPYGNKMGTASGDHYRFALYDNDRYSITVEAPGFQSAKYMLDPNESLNFLLEKDIELTLATATPTHRVGDVMRLTNLIFEAGKSVITKESYAELDLVVKMLQENTNMVIQLEGHTDYQGVAKDNMRLSQERVDAVKEYLVSKKINKNRIKTKAFGGTTPLSRDNTAEAHRLNRRVELRILAY
jgi:OOP family OmpA-OmpF porin